jgi:hypothetical protein
MIWVNYIFSNKVLCYIYNIAIPTIDSNIDKKGFFKKLFFFLSFASLTTLLSLFIYKKVKKI